MKKSFLMILAAATFVGCSSTHEELTGDENAQIALRSTTLNATASSRSPFEGAISTTNKLVTRVLGSTGTSYSTIHSDGTMTFEGTGAVSYDAGMTEGNGEFPGAGGTGAVNLFGLYPVQTAAATSNTWVKGSGTYDIVFTGQEDIMASSIVSTLKTDVQAKTFKTLNFGHLLTKLEVKFKADNTAIPLVGTVTSLQLIGNLAGTDNVKNKVLYDFGTSTDQALVANFNSAGVTTMDFYGLTDTDGTKAYTNTAYTGQTYVVTTESVLQAYAMVAPVTATEAAGQEYFLLITTSVGGPHRIGVDLLQKDKTPFVGNTAGRSFSLVIHFTKDDIKVEATVTDWVEEGESVTGVPTDA